MHAIRAPLKAPSKYAAEQCQFGSALTADADPRDERHEHHSKKRRHASLKPAQRPRAKVREVVSRKVRFLPRNAAQQE